MRRLRRALYLAALSSPAVLGLACQPGGFTTTGPAAKTETVSVPVKVNIGLPLYPKAPAPAVVAAETGSGTLVVPNAVIKFAEKQLVPAQVSGYIELVAIQLAPGTKYDPADRRIVFHPRDKDKSRVFRMIYPGDMVQKGQIVASLDAQQIETQYANARRMIEAGKRGMIAANEGLKVVKELRDDIKKAGSSIAKSELLQIEVQISRFDENLVQSEQNQLKALQEYETAETLLRKHKPSAVVTGMVTQVLKRPGEYVKEGDPILEIQDMEAVLIEGMLPVQYFDQVKPGMKVRIESTKPVAENRELGMVSHRREVTGLAVTHHASRPLVVSGGLDGVVLIWEPYAKKSPHSLSHGTTGVRSLALTGAAVNGCFLATGCEDGKIRFWDLSNPDQLPAKELRSTEDGHASPVTALSYTPDGKYLASAAGREVIVWEAATGKKLYILPADHKDTVTALRFTPQGTLVTVCRDKGVRIWNIGAEGANLATTLDHRAGVIDQLTVSTDGGRVLFDQEEGRIDLVNLADGQSLGTILAAGQARFGTLAVFSPDDQYVLTGGGDSMRGELQLWETPKARGRGYERLRIATPGRVPVTCAAFSPDGTKKFIAVGTQSGAIHLWTPPSPTARRDIFGTVESVLYYNDKESTVRVRVTNPPADVLQDRGRANIIIATDAMAMSPVPANPSAVVPTLPAVAPASGLEVVPSALPPGTLPPGTLNPGSFLPAIPDPTKKN